MPNLTPPDEINPSYSLSEQNFWLNLDKPIGFSSAKCVAIVKRMLGAKKVGHGGTLDPFADGILPIAVNKATKTAEKLMATKKKYNFRISFGEFRDTDDVEGVVTESSDARPTNSQIISALPFFIGKIEQTPSRFSAIKINGRRAYELARKGVEFEVPKRIVEILTIKLISNNPDSAEFEIECSKGTYVRSLSRAICEKIGVCGFVSRLTRLEVGPFLYEKRISLDALKTLITLRNSFTGGSLLSLQDVSKLDS
jgi:tRNA pseudouridine55 synthase